MKRLKHWWIRRKVGLDHLDVSQFRLRIARTREDYRQAFRLLQVGYMFQGIEPVNGRELRINEHHVLRREATVILACEGDQVVGTMTFTLDSPAGLPLDGDFPQELRALRAEPERLGELGSFAIVRRCWRSGVSQLLGMACVQLAIRQGAQRLVIGIHPRAEDIYAALWGFHRLAAPQRHCSLAAPVVGMQVEIAEIVAHAKRHYPRPFSWSGSTLAQHLARGASFPCFALPPYRDLTSRQFERWKMESHVHEELFRRDSDRWATLSSDVRDYARRTGPQRLRSSQARPSQLGLLRAS
jgi:hypothetical protein